MPVIPPVLRSAFIKYAYIFPFLQLLVFAPIQMARTDQERDTSAYYLAAEKVRSGENMYEPYPPPGLHPFEHWYYVYPPFLAAFLALTPELSFQAFATLWLFVLLLAFWVFAACLGRILVGATTVRGTLIAGALLHFAPGTIQALNIGQADVLVWALVGVAFAYPSFRGVGFMAAALTKIHGAWPLAVAIVREGRVVLKGASVSLVVAVAVALYVLGPSAFITSCLNWFARVLPAVSQAQFDFGPASATLVLPFGMSRELNLPSILPPNLSISAAPLHLAQALGWWAPPTGDLPLAIRLYLSGTAVGAPLLAAWLFRGRTAELQCALVFSAALLFAPILRVSGLPVFLAPLAMFYVHSKRKIPSPG